MVADTLLNLILRGVYVLIGVGAVLALVRAILFLPARLLRA